MKNKFLHKILFPASLFIVLSVHSQSDQTAYAVTDSTRDGVKWNYLRTLNMQTGAYSNILLRLLNNNELQPPNMPAIISTNAVAAVAYDKKNKRLYYTPMVTDRLSYIDLRTMRSYVVTNSFTGLRPKASDQSNIITRMVIGDDDKGYALTNDGLHLIRFKTNNNAAITDLGALVDAPGNNEMSVHNTCSSFGGDIIADEDDNLYLFTLRNYVFKINIHTRVARYLGTITGLPATFATSAAAVDKSRERILLVSATDASGAYSLNLRTLIASRVGAGNSWHTSDLASNYILNVKDRHGYHREDMMVSNTADNDNIQLYPNPVISKEFKIQFTDTPAGVYTVEVMDVNGKPVTTKSATISGKNNIIPISLPEQISSGIYIVRITDSDRKAWFSGKIVVQQ